MCAPAMSFKEIFNSGIWEGHQKLTDGFLQTDDGKTFKIHRVILVQRSGYFRACFNFSLKQETAVLRNVDSQILESILIYIYTDTITLDENNVWNLLITSDYLLIDDLLKRCRSFALRSMTIENCLSSLPITYQIESMAIKDECFRYVLVNFDDILETSNGGLEDLPLEIFKQLLQSSSLNVSSERSVWEAIVRWAQACSSTRLQHVSALLTSLKLEEKDDDEEDLATEILSHNITSNNPYCQDLMRMKQVNYKWSNCKLLSHHARSEAISQANSPTLYNPRVPSRLYVIARHAEPSQTFGSELFLTYDGKLDYWRLVGETNFFIDFMVQIGQYIYMFNAWENINLIFDIIEEDFLPISVTAGPRRNAFIVSLNDQLYSIGGSYHGHDSTNIMYSYEFDRNRWKSIGMTHYIIIYGAVTLNKRICIVGMVESESGPILVFQAYEPETDAWISLPPPIVVRKECSVVAFKEQVFIIAGENNGKNLTNVEVYNPLQNSWMSLPDLTFQYFFPKAVVVDDRLIVYEYTNGNTRFYKVPPPVYWHEDAQKWQVIEKSSLLYSMERYSFLALDDQHLLQNVTEGNRGPGLEWERIIRI